MASNTQLSGFGRLYLPTLQTEVLVRAIGRDLVDVNTQYEIYTKTPRGFGSLPIDTDTITSVYKKHNYNIRNEEYFVNFSIHEIGSLMNCLVQAEQTAMLHAHKLRRFQANL